jgi:glyoxylase-like metal-dependent hydrolase (beta-lactamase superfamily II)/rhodanese-related sulfurtransferase
MEIKQIYTGCLAQGAYYIESNGRAAIIDPLREVQPYIDMANARGAKIDYILETHFHADFVSGHLTLSEKTGAPIIYGPTAKPSFDARIVQDGEELSLGNVSIKVLHTPGHTMESTCYLLLDAEGKEHAVFTGDTLFLGDVGRPDLAQKAADMTQEELAGTLFESLRSKIMTLPDETIVYPGHGAGSACGKNMSSETVGTIGGQKAENYALRADMTKEEFVKEVTDGLLAPPAYFPLNVKMNKEGYEHIEDVIARGETAMKPEAFEAVATETGAVVLDVRHQSQFAAGHVPRSIFIGLDGGFAPWVGALIKDVEQSILLVVEEARLTEAITRLSRVGFDKVLGHLEGGVEAWKEAGKELDTVDSITSEEFAERMHSAPLPVVDVRKESEYANGHVQDAMLAPLDALNDHLAGFESRPKAFLHCAGGYRSMIAISILKSRGIHGMIDIQGGFGAIKNTNVPQEAGSPEEA